MYTAVVSKLINAPLASVWEALTTPEIIRQYLFDTEVTSTWQIGSPITFKGVWEGKPYEDKGIILNAIPHELLEMTYWSPLSGVPDAPEHYKKVTYRLLPQDAGTFLTIIQDNNPTEEAKEHAEQNWRLVIQNIKELLEERM